MSRVANAPISLPKPVEVKLSEDEITVKGPKGELTQKLVSSVQVVQEDGQLRVSTNDENRDVVAHSGTIRALISNMVHGVTEGFEKKLQLVGVGYKATVKGDEVHLNLGFSHPVIHKLPPGVKAEATTPTELVLKGSCKQRVGQECAVIRSYRPPEPYKGKGVRYSDERVVIKETKKK